MNLTPSENSPTARRRLERALGYAAITIFVLTSYIAIVGLYENFVERVLPQRDPFTYTVGWFRLVDAAHGHYLRTILAVFAGHLGGWYRLMNVEIALLSPILTKDPAVLCIVNYLIWGLGTAAWFRLGLAMELDVGRAFIVALIPWLWPVDYGFMDYTSVPVLALDAAFTGALLLAVANSFVFALNPRSMVRGIVAGLSIGVAVWGRGNSAPFVALVVAWPCLLAVWNAWRSGDRRAGHNVAVAGILAAAMTAEFYATYWSRLVEYYSVDAQLTVRHHWNLHDAMPYLKNIPGFMYWRIEDSPLTMGLSWASHFVPILALVLAWFGDALAPERRKACRQLALGGALTYFGTYLLNLLLFTDPAITLDSATLIWRPMLIGLSLSVVVVFLWITDPLKVRHDLRMVMPAGALVLAWGFVWSTHYTPWDWSIEAPTPRAVEQFALQADQMLEGSGPLAFLWYGNWNRAIVDYYRAKNDLPNLPLYHPEGEGKIWSISDFSPENRARVLEGVKQTFLKAGMIIVSEYLDYYGTDCFNALFCFKQDWADWLNSAEAPRLRVRMLLTERTDARLLVLQREELAHGRGDPFQLPWGYYQPDTPLPVYSDAVVRMK